MFSSTKNDGASPLIHTQLQLGGNELRLNSSTVSTVSQCRKRETVETVKQVVRTHSATQLKQGVNEIGLGSVRLLLYILFTQQAIQTPTFTGGLLT